MFALIPVISNAEWSVYRNSLFPNLACLYFFMVQDSLQNKDLVFVFNFSMIKISLKPLIL